MTSTHSIENRSQDLEFESDCSICLSPLRISEKLVNLDCNHKFHYDCLIKITNNACPLCRGKIITEEVCPGNHTLVSYFSVSYLKKNGKCTYCKRRSFKYHISKKIIS